MRFLTFVALVFFPMATTMVSVPVVTRTVEATAAKYSQKELDCLAKNLYHEARGEGFIGMEAVAMVTLNRVKAKGFPSDICDVVYQESQFSWTAVEKKVVDTQAWQQAKHIVQYAVNATEDITDGALFFHAKHVKPQWAKHFDVALVVNNHIFYKRRSQDGRL